MIILKCRTAERPIAGRRACNLPQGSVPGYLAAVDPPHSARLFRERVRAVEWIPACSRRMPTSDIADVREFALEGGDDRAVRVVHAPRRCGCSRIRTPSGRTQEEVLSARMLTSLRGCFAN